MKKNACNIFLIPKEEFTFIKIEAEQIKSKVFACIPTNLINKKVFAKLNIELPPKEYTVQINKGLTTEGIRIGN